MNKAFIFLETVLIAGVTASAVFLYRTINTEEATTSVMAAGKTQTTDEQAEVTEQASGVAVKRVSPRTLMSMFFIPPGPVAEQEETAPEETPEIALPRIRYAGKIQYEDTETVYLFTLGDSSSAVKLTAGGTSGELRLTEVLREAAATRFIFEYRGTFFEIRDR
ncbi:MAG: hypothetical protein JXB03_09850 [Spirochaetales bacterium]|nr:hypothetical protein [Spirochaetales bacterium]